MNAAQRRLGHAGSEEALPKRPAHRRPNGPRLLRHGKAGRFNDEAAHDDKEEHSLRVGEFACWLEPRWPHDEAPPARHAKPDGKEKPEEIKGHFKEQIERPLQYADIEKESRDFPVDRGDHCAGEQREKSPEHRHMHDARIGLR